MAAVNIQKVGIVGTGFVGTSIAFTLLQKGLFSEMVLIDVNRDKAEGEAMDLSHGIPFAKPMTIRAGDYGDIADAGLVIVTAGAAQKPGETRLDLVNKNVGIFKSIIPEIAKRNRDAILLIVSNPVDILTYAAWRLSGYPQERVIGSGTVLDSARLRYLLGQRLAVNPQSVHAYIIGEHGDSELAVWSEANVSGIALDQFCEFRGYRAHAENEQEIYEHVVNAAYDIIQKKGATYFGVGMAVGRIAEALFRDEHAVMPVSVNLRGIYGIKGDLFLSMPAIVGAAGIEKVLPLDLSAGESERLFHSVTALQGIIDAVDL
jgi:L-lactate dehydrogenase